MQLCRITRMPDQDTVPIAHLGTSHWPSTHPLSNCSPASAAHCLPQQIQHLATVLSNAVGGKPGIDYTMHGANKVRARRNARSQQHLHGAAWGGAPYGAGWEEPRWLFAYQGTPLLTLPVPNITRYHHHHHHHHHHRRRRRRHVRRCPCTAATRRTACRAPTPPPPWLTWPVTAPTTPTTRPTPRVRCSAIRRAAARAAAPPCCRTRHRRGTETLTVRSRRSTACRTGRARDWRWPDGTRRVRRGAGAAAARARLHPARHRRQQHQQHQHQQQQWLDCRRMAVDGCWHACALAWGQPARVCVCVSLAWARGAAIAWPWPRHRAGWRA